MDSLLISAASGMRARMESLEMLANNMANTGTSGYKTDREFYSLYVSAEAAGPAEQGNGPDADTQPVIEKHWTDLSQGSLRQTGNSLDLALDGKGFFVVNGPTGPLYTRNGSMRVASSGELTSPDGYPLQMSDGTTLKVGSNSPIEVNRDGAIQQDGQQIGQLSVVDFPDQTAIDKRGMNYYYALDPKLKPVASSAEIRQGTVEDSNVGPAESAVRLVSIMRQFESLQKAITIGADMNKHAIEEVARVGS